jgi:hypothetical protein
MLTNPGFPFALVHDTLYVPRLPLKTLPFAGAIREKPSVPMATEVMLGLQLLVTLNVMVVWPLDVSVT